MTKVELQIKKTYTASVSLRSAAEKDIKLVLKTLADSLEAEMKALLKANAKDLSRQEPGNPRNDRLMLNEQRVRSIAASIRKVSRLPDPTGKLLDKRKLANGLLVEKRSVPLGVVGAIYESRPNVTFDIATLCIRSRNACVLKGSQEAEETNKLAIRLIKKSITGRWHRSRLCDTASLRKADGTGTLYRHPLGGCADTPRVGFIDTIC